MHFTCEYHCGKYICFTLDEKASVLYFDLSKIRGFITRLAVCDVYKQDNYILSTLHALNIAVGSVAAEEKTSEAFNVILITNRAAVY